MNLHGAKRSVDAATLNKLLRMWMQWAGFEVEPENEHGVITARCTVVDDGAERMERYVRTVVSRLDVTDGGIKIDTDTKRKRIKIFFVKNK